MKRSTLRMKLMTTASLLMLGVSQLFAQHEILVPAQSNFYDVIMGDTLSDGSRRDPDVIYLLKRSDVYKIDRSMAIDFNFILKGEDGDASSMPAILVPQLNVEGSYPDNYFNFIGDNISVHLSNLILQGIPSDYEHKVTGKIATVAVAERGDSIRMFMDRVVITGFANHAVSDESKGGYAKFTNCVLRNIGELKDEWGGTGLGHWNQVGTLDTMIVQNCTFFNVGCGVIATTEIYKHILIEHNTFFGSITGFGGMGNDQISMIIKDNIYFGAFGQGVPKREIPLWTDKEGVFQGPTIFELDTIRAPRDQYIKDVWGIDNIWDRKITMENNLVWWPERLVKAWDTLDYDGGAVAHPRVINPWTQKMLNDHPDNFTLIDTITGTDPQFDETTVNRLLDISLDWIWNKRHTDDWPGFYRLFDDEEHMYRLQWPLPEDLAYKNEALATASTEELHLGDLNWFPEDKAKWDEMQGNPSAVKSLSGSYFELSNYPNPFTNSTTIHYTLDKVSRVNLTVYDISGKEVTVLVDQIQPAGNYNIDFNGNGYNAGIYFYKLQSETLSTTNRMILIK